MALTTDTKTGVAFQVEFLQLITPVIRGFFSLSKINAFTVRHLKAATRLSISIMLSQVTELANYTCHIQESSAQDSCHIQESSAQQTLLVTSVDTSCIWRTLIAYNSTICKFVTLNPLV